MKNMLGNYIDIIIALYLAMCLIGGTRKTVPIAASDLASLILGIVFSLATYGWTADFLSKNLGLASAYANVLGFFMNIFAIKIMLLFLFDRIFKRFGNTFGEESAVFNKFLSAIISLVYGFIIIIVMLSATVSLSLPSFIAAEMEQSRFIAATERDPLKINEHFQKIFGNFYNKAAEDLSFMNIRTGPQESDDLGFKTMEFTIDSKSEDDMLELVNQERVFRGLKAVKMDEEARRAARDYGEYLFKNGLFSHTDLNGKGPSDRIKNYKVEFMVLGENLAYAPSLSEAHDGLMNSKSHRENILNPFFSHAGIGVIDAGDYGKIFVQEFWG